MPDDPEVDDKDEIPSDLPSIKRWVKRTMWGAAATAFTVAVYWFGGFVADAAQATADRHITSVMATAIPSFADPVYLRKTAFDEYQQAQVKQANEADLRSIDLQIAEKESQLQYGNLTPQQRGQIEFQLKVLRSQREELVRSLSQ